MTFLLNRQRVYLGAKYIMETWFWDRVVRLSLKCGMKCFLLWNQYGIDHRKRSNNGKEISILKNSS